MVGSKALFCGVSLTGVALVVGAARADGPRGAPSTLRMRSAADRAPVRRLAQAAPDPAPADASAGDASPPGLASGAGGGPPLDGVPRFRPDRLVVAAPIASEVPPGGITVTGSLIERATATSPSPVTILGREELLGAGRTMVGDIVQPLPAQANGINAQFNNGGDGATRIDLRGLGADRTLVLLNGRRFVPVGLGADSSVDLNTIPLAVIERVEVMKGGGSAVYGSGAIAGVVNILTRTELQGTETSLYTGQSSRNDGFTLDASVASGHAIDGGRGHILFAAEVQRQEPVSAGDREFSRVFRRFDFDRGQVTISGSPATPGGRIDPRQLDVNGDGIPDGFNLCGAQFCTSDGHGGFRPFLTPGDLYNFQPSNYAYTPSSRVSAYTAGHHRVAPGADGFYEASWTRRESTQQLAPEPLNLQSFGLVISRDSLYNPLGAGVLGYLRRLEELGPRRFVQGVDTLRVVAGLRSADAAAPDRWRWELSLNYGRTDATQRNEGSLIVSRLRAAIGPSFISPSSGPTCGTPFAPIPGCVPMNLLGPSGSISAAARDYVAFTGVMTGSSEQQMALATAHGRLFRLPGGGDVALAVSADVRREAGDLSPDALIASGDTTALTQAATHGQTSIAEAAAELSIVPVRDGDGVERLEIDLAARAFRQGSAQSGAISEIRALARPVRGVTLRTSYAASFRAPSIGELFQAQLDAFPAASDPCDHAFRVAGSRRAQPSSVEQECAREGVPPGAVFGTFQQRVIQHGNPKLAPETAKVFDAGIVLESPRAPGLSLSADYWNIELAQKIELLLINTVFTGCYERGIRTFCDLVHRDRARGGAIDFVDTPFFNLGGTTTSGVDAALGFDRRVPGGGELHARLDVQQLIAFDIDETVSVLRGLGVYDLGVHPRRKASLFAAWQAPDGGAVGANAHFVDSFQECNSNNCNDPANRSRTVDSWFKLDVFARLALRQGRARTTVAVGVNNVLDRPPPLVFNGIAVNSDESAYDFVGRFFYARVTQTF